MIRNFAAFIMTYERPNEVLAMIGKLFSQSFPPEKILVVDNSATENTAKALYDLNDHRIEHFRTGYNAGPAGASALALKKLTDEGYRWIFWGDDNDPPRFLDDFNRLLKLANQHAPGIIGAVGHKFDRRKGTIMRIPTALLSGLLEVDTVAGGDCMLVNAEVVKHGVLPDKKLFFGFEEFDFCYRIKKAGFKILVDGDLFYKYREVSGNLQKQRKLFNVKKSKTYLVREYYSKRNLLYIFKKNRLFIPLMSLIGRSVVKCVAGFRYGVTFGASNFSMVFKALLHGMLNIMGKTIDIR